MAKRILVKGMVQGAGLELLLHELATRLDLRAWMRPAFGGAEILVEGQNSSIEDFIRFLILEKPFPGPIDSIQVAEDAALNSLSPELREPWRVFPDDAPLFTDIAICPDCERELFQPTNARYLYPFVNCGQCGPRFTILNNSPYDRSNTTLAKFPLCERCRAEYSDPLNRRFGAHTISCPDCGPFVELRETHSQFPSPDPRISSIEIRVSAILKARRLLREGYIVGIKGSGGFQLACDASNPYTLAELRDRQGRGDKPFSVMAADLPAVRSICEIEPAADPLLTGPQKPILILAKKRSTGSLNHTISELVAPGLDTLGVMLPHTALYHLLMNQTDPVLAREAAPPILALAGGGLSEEPLVIDNKDALEKLSPLADAFLLHNRDIVMPADDSVMKVQKDRTIFLRRARGFAPYRVELSHPVHHTLAVGGASKGVFCLARDRSAFISQHLSNLQNATAHPVFERGVQHLLRLFDVQPEILALDLHSSFFAAHPSEDAAIQQVEVQHQHAHIVSCMVDNALSNRRVIGLCFDGPGCGTDGALWGGEVLLASYSEFKRFAHLEYLPLPAVEWTTHASWQLAAGYAHLLGIGVDGLPFLQNVDKNTLRRIRQHIDRQTDLTLTSSMGMFFNAVASLIGIRNHITYEGQASMEMEALSKPFLPAAESYPYSVDQVEEGPVIGVKDMLLSMIRDIVSGEPVGMLSARFHMTVAKLTVEICRQARETTGLNEVVLSGSVWQNQTLSDLVRDGLVQAGFCLYSHNRLPTNDAGLALGQVVTANFQVYPPAEPYEQADKQLSPDHTS